ncbi:MAG: Gfo/Idh/MocA family protein [Anaerolineae bacterium]
MSDSIKVGIVGAGAIASQVHIPAYRNLPGVEIVAVADTKKDRAQQVAKEHGIPNAYGDCRDMFAQDGIDVISVCSPNAFHAPQSIAALEAGINVLCEKPMAIRLDDALAMVEASQRTGKLLMIGMTSRFRADFQTMRSYVQDGLLGDVYYIKAGWLRRTGIPGYGSWFTNKELSGGGSLLDIGVHFLDIAMWIAGFPKPVAVSGTTFAKFGPRAKALGGWGADIYRSGPQRFDVDDLATAFVRMEDGSVLTLEVSWAAYTGEQGENYVRIFGTEGGVELNSRYGDYPVRFHSEKNDAQYDSTVYVGPTKAPHQVEIAHFLDCVRGEAKPVVPLEESVTIAKILDAIYRSGESGKEVAIA